MYSIFQNGLYRFRFNFNIMLRLITRIGIQILQVENYYSSVMVSKNKNTHLPRRHYDFHLKVCFMAESKRVFTLI